MPDMHFLVSLRRRLRVPNPASVGDMPICPTCQHRSVAHGVVCGAAVDVRGHHACVCETGGGVVHRHDRCRDWLAGWIAEQSGQIVSTEQYVPRWDRQVVGEDGRLKWERARLDVVYHDRNCRPVYVDMAVTDAITVMPTAARTRAARDGQPPRWRMSNACAIQVQIWCRLWLRPWGAQVWMQ